MKKIRNKIGYRLIGLMVLFSILIMLVSTAVQVKVSYDENIKETMSRFETLHKSYLPSITKNIWLLDTERLQSLIDGIRHQPEFQYAGIYSDTGEVLATAGEVKSDRVIKISSELRHQFRGNNNLIGRFELVASKDGALERAYQDIWTILLTNSIIIILLATAIFAAVHGLITKHIVRMADYTRQFSMENIDQPLNLDRVRSVSVHDEIHDLEASFNQMRERLKTYYDGLRLLNRELERRVTERTSALSESEARLKEAQAMANLGNWSWDAHSGPFRPLFPIYSDHRFQSIATTYCGGLRPVW